MDGPARPDSTDSALVVIDVQNDFCAPDGVLAARRGVDVGEAAAAVDQLELLIEAARSADIPVVFVRTEHSEALSSGPWGWRKGKTDSQPACLPDTPGAEFYRVAPEPSDAVITKHRYSAFVGTALDDLLRCLDRRSLVFTGVRTHICVESTLRDAVNRNYYATLVPDCCAAYSPASHDATVRTVASHFGSVVDSQTLRGQWGGM